MEKYGNHEARLGWNPPRLSKFGVHGVESGTIPGGTTWEGSQNEMNCPVNPSPSTNYRMPTSGEPIPCPYPWQ